MGNRAHIIDLRPELGAGNGPRRSAFLKALCAAAVIGLCAFIAFRGLKTRADLAVLYPSSCLGGWENPAGAEGRPDIADAGEEVFTSENSARIGDAAGELFCGSFGGDIPEGTAPQTIRLTVSWGVGTFPAPAQEKPEEKPIMDMASTTTEAAGTTTPSEEIPEEIIAPEQENEEPPEELPASPPDEEPPPEEPSEQPQSFLWKKNFAPSHALAAGDALLSVSYTLDGVSWSEVGTLSADGAQTAFELPAPASWDEVSNLQIRITRLPTLDDAEPEVFVDGMALEVSYSPATTSAPFVSASGLYITDPQSLTSEVQVQTRENDAQENELVIVSASPLGGLAVYNASTGALALTTFIGGTSYVLQPAYFGEGAYAFILTRDPDTCSQRSLDECRIAPDFRGEGKFTVTASSSDLIL